MAQASSIHGRPFGRPQKIASVLDAASGISGKSAETVAATAAKKNQNPDNIAASATTAKTSEAFIAAAE